MHFISSSTGMACAACSILFLGLLSTVSAWISEDDLHDVACASKPASNLLQSRGFVEDHEHTSDVDLFENGDESDAKKALELDREFDMERQGARQANSANSAKDRKSQAKSASDRELDKELDDLMAMAESARAKGTDEGASYAGVGVEACDAEVAVGFKQCRGITQIEKHAQSKHARKREGNGEVAAGGIAVYTYDVGSYDRIRSDYVPCVPPGMDAFFFLDNSSIGGATDGALQIWKDRGWQIVSEIPNVSQTEFVSKDRIAAKSLKFTPPSWLTDGPYEWLVSFDSDKIINLHELESFLKPHASKPLLLLDWYWATQNNCSNGFDCMLAEANDMLTRRKNYIASSRKNVLGWLQNIKKMHVDGKYNPPHYFETCITFRNLAHPKADIVAKAFHRMFEECTRIQRDQFVAPYILWQAGLVQDVEVLQVQKLYTKLSFCNAKSREKRNLLQTG